MICSTVYASNRGFFESLSVPSSAVVRSAPAKDASIPLIKTLKVQNEINHGDDIELEITASKNSQSVSGVVIEVNGHKEYLYVMKKMNNGKMKLRVRCYDRSRKYNKFQGKKFSLKIAFVKGNFMSLKRGEYHKFTIGIR